MKKYRGSILPLAIVMVILLAIIGVGMLMLGQGTRIFAARNVADVSARLAADAGITKALRGMNKKLFAERGSWSWPDSSLASFSGSMDNAYSSYSVSITGGSFLLGYNVASTGTSGNATRVVHAKFDPKSSFFGIGVKESIVVKKNATFDTWPTSGGELILQTTSNDGKDGQIELTNGVVIPGDVIVGAGGDATDIIKITGNNDIEDVILGDAYASIEEVDFPPVTLPKYLVDLAAESITTTSTINNKMGKYTQIDLGNGGIFKVEGNCEILVTNKMQLGKGATLVLADNANLVLYLDCNLENKNTTDLGFTIEGNIRSGMLKIYGTDNCQKIDIKNSGTFYGDVYAPNADIQVYNGGDVYGAFVGKDFTLNNSGKFYFDTNIVNFSAASAEVSFGIARWWED